MEVYRLANIKSAKKRSTASTHTRYVYLALPGTTFEIFGSNIQNKTTAKDKAAAEAAYKDASSVIESACSKGVYHKNNAARKVSRLAKLVNGIA